MGGGGLKKDSQSRWHLISALNGKEGFKSKDKNFLSY